MAQDVSAVILAKIRAGALPAPSDRSIKPYAGKGTNKTCDGCGRTIRPDDIEHEVDLADNRTLRFHQQCFNVWQAAGGNP
jgi:methionyl-tRNA synthetase